MVGSSDKVEQRARYVPHDAPRILKAGRPRRDDSDFIRRELMLSFEARDGKVWRGVLLKSGREWWKDFMRWAGVEDEVGWEM